MGDGENAVRAFVDTILIPIAFTSGIWRAIGTSPANETISILTRFAESQVMQEIIAALGLSMLLIFAGGVVASYLFGKILGLASFASAFASGMLVVSAPNISVYLLVLSFVLAIIAPFIHHEGDKRGGPPRVAPPR